MTRNTPIPVTYHPRDINNRGLYCFLTLPSGWYGISFLKDKTKDHLLYGNKKVAVIIRKRLLLAADCILDLLK